MRLNNKKIRKTFFIDKCAWILVQNSYEQDMHSTFCTWPVLPQTSPVFTILLLEPFLEPQLCINSVFIIFLLVPLPYLTLQQLYVYKPDDHKKTNKDQIHKLARSHQKSVFDVGISYLTFLKASSHHKLNLSGFFDVCHHFNNVLAPILLP